MERRRGNAAPFFVCQAILLDRSFGERWDGRERLGFAGSERPSMAALLTNSLLYKQPASFGGRLEGARRGLRDRDRQA